jgi:hypothetical protein
MVDLRGASFFAGPSHTHFLLHPRWLRILSDSAKGAVLPVGDFVEFLVYIDQAEPPLPFTASEGQTQFIIEHELVHIFGEDGTEVVFPVEDLQAFLEHLTRIADAATPALALSVLGNDEPVR